MLTGKETCQLCRLSIGGRLVFFIAQNSGSLNNILLRGVCGWLSRRWVRHHDFVLLTDANLPQPRPPFLLCHLQSFTAASGSSKWHSGW